MVVQLEQFEPLARQREAAHAFCLRRLFILRREKWKWKKERGSNFLSQMKCRGWGAAPAPRGAPWLLEASTGIGHLPSPPLFCPPAPAAPTLLPGEQEPGVFLSDPAGIQFKQYIHVICFVNQHCCLLSNRIWEKLLSLEHLVPF